MSPTAQQRSRRLAAKYRSGMALDELRHARELTQVHLSKILGVNQAAVSKLERRTDMYVSTLQDFVKAMGGELKITARFPEGTVEITQFALVKDATGDEVPPKPLDSIDSLLGSIADRRTPRRRA